MPDMELHGGDGRPRRLHDLIDDSFLALYFTDARRRPPIPESTLPGLKQYVVSRWDAPLDSGLRERALLDVGSRLLKRMGCPPDTLVLVRPDDSYRRASPDPARYRRRAVSKHRRDVGMECRRDRAGGVRPQVRHEAARKSNRKA
jgi:hypothetical protein